MKSLENLKELLTNGVITKDEYSGLAKRIEQKEGSYTYTWGDVLDEFYDWCCGKYSSTTAKGYKICLYKFLLYVTKRGENKKALLCSFSPFTFVMVNNFLKSMQSKNFSSQTVSKSRYAILVLCKFLESKGIDVPDISKIKVSIQDKVNKTAQALSHEEVMRIANAGDLRNKACILLAYEGALRRIELSKVKVSDFNFRKNQLYIYNNDNTLDRVCILTQTTTDVIKEYIVELYANIDRWNKSRESKGKDKREDFGYIFQSVKMIVPSYSVLHSMLKENARKYYHSLKADNIDESISRVTFEVLRNSRKVYLLSKNLQVNDVMQLCGDSNYMSTYRFLKLVPVIYPDSVTVE